MSAPPAKASSATGEPLESGGSFGVTGKMGGVMARGRALSSFAPKKKETAKPKKLKAPKDPKKSGAGKLRQMGKLTSALKMSPKPPKAREGHNGEASSPSPPADQRAKPILMKRSPTGSGKTTMTVSTN